MAEKKRKTQAEKAAAVSNGKNGAGKKNRGTGKKTPDQPHAEKTKIPVRVISSVVFLAMFVMLLVALINPEGKIVEFFDKFVRGIIGLIGLVVSLPAMLYLFIIHAFSGDRPVRMRTVCLFFFIFSCGCLAHIALDPEIKSGGIALIGELYSGGISGVTGGVLCGGVAMFVDWLCGKEISYIIFIVAIILTLLGGMRITIPSVIKAIQDRPRLEWEEEQKKNKPEPAVVVVNHIVKKQNEHKERRRIRAEQIVIPEVVEPAEISKNTKTNGRKNKADDMLQQIEGDVEAPVAAAGKDRKKEAALHDTAEDINPDIPGAEQGVIVSQEPEPACASLFEPVSNDEQIPEVMPALDPDARQEAAHIAKEIKVTPVIKKAKVTAKPAETIPPEPTVPPTEIPARKPDYCFPPIDLLELPDEDEMDGGAEMRENATRLNETLVSFKIDAHIINVTRGPSVTRYDVELAKGVRLGKLTSAAEDIALSLGASGVRIAAVPGKISVVGIEVPNRNVTKVFLREVIDSQEFAKAKSKASFAVGKDISGSCIIGNIAKMPHMLIAGTTGSGKSVCTNSIIISILYKASPDDVKLIMVDPKMVELGNYNGIPHLLIPVVTDPKKAAGSLQWAVTEMMRRYKAMSDEGVRDLESYNSIMENQEIEGGKMPQIVVIIDELADLMLVAAKEVEESICRIAQMGRAAGIHLIIATQRPSSDVITGTMKANIPSRIAFAVASALESRIILDTTGAEKLVGKGDMLYAPIGTGKPRRVQGCFVTDNEVEAVTSYIKANYTSSYDQQIIEEIDKKAAQTGSKSSTPEPEPQPNDAELDGDEMFPEAVDVILETGQASVSMLQRRLKLGYARAARIVDEMEEKGIVGPFAGAKPRAILVTKEQWQTMRPGGSGAQMGFEDLDEEDVYPDEAEDLLS